MRGRRSDLDEMKNNKRCTFVCPSLKPPRFSRVAKWILHSPKRSEQLWANPWKIRQEEMKEKGLKLEVLLLASGRSKIDFPSVLLLLLSCIPSGFCQVHPVDKLLRKPLLLLLLARPLLLYDFFIGNCHVSAALSKSRPRNITFESLYNNCLQTGSLLKKANTEQEEYCITKVILIAIA